jgi:acyl carrier protein
MNDVVSKTAEIMRRHISKSDGGRTSTDGEMMDLRLADLKLDSLEKMELVMALEDTFAVSLDEEDILACERVADLVKLIERPA